MELKKSDIANIDKLRAPIVFIGLLFVSSLVLASFTYTSAIEDTSKKTVAENITNTRYEEEVKQEEKETPVETPQVEAPPLPEEEIIQKENTEKEPETIIAVVPDVPTTTTEEIIAPVEEEIIEFPDVEATFNGNVQQWIAQNIQYPQIAIDNQDQGKVFVSFVVEPDGSVSNVVVERGVSKELDREAKRVVREMPKWTPGEAKGKKIRARCRLPINFVLSN